VRRLLVLVVLATAGVAATAPKAEQPPKIVAPGVRVGDVYVGGLTSEEARARLRWAYGRPLVVSFGARRWRVPARALHAGIDDDAAVTNALRAGAASVVDAPVLLDRRRVSRYVGELDARFSYDAEDAHAYLDGLKPALTSARPGLAVQRRLTQLRIERALRSGIRRRARIATAAVEPTVTEASFGPIIVVRRASNRLLLYDATTLTRTFKVATGRAQYPTPLGSFSIVDKQRDPWWRPPSSAWAKGLKPIPPGPGNPLGTRWMGTSAAGVGIHGTPDAASVGYSASHGCIRMYVPDAEWLFDHVTVGTPVFVVDA
jgi:lipoprotein-anchoring transpeptidase ErfK/SrfK